ncbi:MAG: hydroxymethylbilane synthase, partial [Pseudomonadota bacterium]
MLQAINHGPTLTALLCERAFLNVLDGSCRTPIAGHATLDGTTLHFRGMILSPDGGDCLETKSSGSINDAEKIGRDAGLQLKNRAPQGFFDAA